MIILYPDICNFTLWSINDTLGCILQYNIINNCLTINDELYSKIMPFLTKKYYFEHHFDYNGWKIYCGDAFYLKNHIYFSTLYGKNNIQILTNEERTIKEIIE